MKIGKIRFFSSIMIMGFVLFLMACTPKTDGKTLGDAAESAVGKSESVDLKNSGVILFNGAAVYEEKNGGMVYKTTANIGNVVKWKNSVKNAVRKSDGQEREFAQIEMDKETLWIQTAFVAPQAIPGIIIGDETVLYKKADAASPSGKTIAKNTLIAVHPDTKEGPFIAISAYVDGDKSPLITKQFVKSENIVTEANDVRGLQLYTIAMISKDAVVRKELLKSALETNSRFSDIIQAEFDKLTSGAGEAEPATVEATGTLTVNDDNVNVRDRPNETAGVVVAKLSKGATVTVTAKTSEMFTVGGTAAVWYKISEPAGWVFGSFLSE